MNDKIIVSKMNEYLYTATQELCTWLNKMLPRVTDEWWRECVLENLSHSQRDIALDNDYDKLEQFDLAALLRIADKSWYDMRSFAYLPTSDRECVRAMVKVRNNWAHFSGSVFDKDVLKQKLNKNVLLQKRLKVMQEVTIKKTDLTVSALCMGGCPLMPEIVFCDMEYRKS